MPCLGKAKKPESQNKLRGGGRRENELRNLVRGSSWRASQTTGKTLRVLFYVK